MQTSLGKLFDQKERAGAGSSDASWPWKERLDILLDVCDGMQQMHSKKFIHRDLKPDNILLNDDMSAKIADLGMARTNRGFDPARIASLAQRRARDARQQKIEWTGTAGTPIYFSPEAIREYRFAQQQQREASTDSTSSRGTPRAHLSIRSVGGATASGGGNSGGGNSGGGGGNDDSGGRRKPIGAWHAMDVFAFSLIAWETLVVKRPWQSMGVHEVWDHVAKGHRPLIWGQDAANAPPGYVELVRRMWAQDPVVRPTFAEVAEALRRMAARLEAPPSPGAEKEQEQEAAPESSPARASAAQQSSPRREANVAIHPNLSGGGSWAQMRWTPPAAMLASSCPPPPLSPQRRASYGSIDSENSDRRMFGTDRRLDASPGRPGGTSMMNFV